MRLPGFGQGNAGAWLQVMPAVLGAETESLVHLLQQLLCTSMTEAAPVCGCPPSCVMLLVWLMLSVLAAQTCRQLLPC